MNKSILYLLFFISLTGLGQSNTLYQKTYTKQDGLTIDYIRTMVFDNDGFLWLGGTNLNTRTIVLNKNKLAIQRYNGFSFHDVIIPEIENKPIVEVLNFYKRKDGKFYINIKTDSGLALVLFDPVTALFTTMQFDDNVIMEGISKVFSYNNEDYILSQTNRSISLNKIAKDLNIETLFSFTSNENKFLIENATIFIPFKDYCIIGDDNFPITFLDWKGNIIKRFAVDTFVRDRNINTSKFWLNEVFTINNTTYGFIENNPVMHIIDTVALDVKPLKNTSLYSDHLKTYKDALGNTMVLNSVDNTINFNTLENDEFKTIHQSNIENISSMTVASQNLNESVWLATNGKLHHITFPKKTVKTYLSNLSLRVIKPFDSINYLVATESNGWFTLNTKTNTTKPYTIIENGKPLAPYSSRNIILEGDTIWSNSQGNILKVNKKTKTAEAYRHYPIICMEKNNDSTIIYGTNGYNLMQFNTNTKSHTALAKTDSLYIYDIEIKKEDNLVVAGTDKGLLAYNLKTKTTDFYNAPSQLEDPFILMTDYHKDYGYLLGSRSGIITAFNPENKNFITIYKDELKAGIAAILFDNDVWWINTFNGIVAFNPEDKTTTRFSEKDGFSHFEGNRYSALNTENGFFFGMIKGLNFFNPKELKVKNDSASLELLKVKHFNTKEKIFKNYFNRKTFNNNYSIVLPSENRALDIDFGLKNINAVNNGYSFKYRLDDKDWVEQKDKNSIQFPNLASGKYTLEIEATDYSGNKVGESLLVDINSKALFYKTWWFFLLVSLIAISILLWVLNQTNMRRRLQQQFSQGLIQSQEDERKRIAKELHDSISQQLTLIKKKAQNTNQEEITSLTHNTLEEVRAISRGLYPPLLKQLGLTESIEQLILEVDEQTELFVSGDIDNIDAFFNEAQTLNCYRFIQECINNCLKHANAKAISISALKENNSIEITIKDNGKGFDATNAQKQNSLGLKTIYERIRILKGELTIDSKPNKGTTITAKLPITNG